MSILLDENRAAIHIQAEHAHPIRILDHVKFVELDAAGQTDAILTNAHPLSLQQVTALKYFPRFQWRHLRLLI